MDSILTKNLNLKSYIKIVVNVSKPLWSGEGEEIQDHEEQKIYSAGVPHQSSIENESKEPTIYSIKIETNRKSAKQIRQVIKEEHGFIANDAQIWNQMIDEISQLSIDNQSSLRGMIC